MRVIASLFLFVLAACGQSATAPAPEAPPVQAAAPASLTGQFVAMSNTAMSITGDLSLTADLMDFGQRGFRLAGARTETTLQPDTDFSAGGGTIADASGVQGVETIELRRIDHVVVAADARDPLLCGEGRSVSFVLLARNSDTLSVLVFSGAQPPGPNAHDSQLCGIFNYTPS